MRFGLYIAAASLAAQSWLFAAIPKDRGQKLVESVCTLCHELRRVTIQQLSRQEWEGLVRGMLDEGAPVTDEEFSLIVDYLAKHYGVKTPPPKDK